MEARPDVLLVVGNGLVFLDVALVVVNERDIKMNKARTLRWSLLPYYHLDSVTGIHFSPCGPEQQLRLNIMNV